MINIALTATLYLGLFLIIIMGILLLVRHVKPEISDDIDLIIITLGMLYGFIIIIHGWRLDPILFFSQVILVFIIVIFGFLIIRLRMVALILKMDNEDLIKENQRQVEFLESSYKDIDILTAKNRLLEDEFYRKLLEGKN